MRYGIRSLRSIFMRWSRPLIEVEKVESVDAQFMLVARVRPSGFERLSLSHSVYLHQLHFSASLVLAINRFC
jgi:hypothetical protein